MTENRPLALELLGRYYAEKTPFDLPGSATATSLEAIEAGHLNLPADFRDFLEIHDGAFVPVGAVLGLSQESGDSIELVAERFPMWRDHSWLPVVDDSCGNYYVVDCSEGRRNGAVGFVEATVDAGRWAYGVASNFWSLLRGMLQKEFDGGRWPFEIDYFREHDPTFLTLDEIGKPWEA